MSGPQTMPRFMIDIETLGSKPDGAIASIGVALFNFLQPGSTARGWRVDIQSCLDVGLKIDLDTCLWWMKQDDVSRREIYTERSRKPITEALSGLARFIAKHGGGYEYEVWSRGPDYDLTILETAYERIGLEAPWGFRNKRDVRSVLAVCGDEIADTRTAGRHTARGDCLTQIVHLQRAVRPELFGDI